jgi:cytochrome bd ubiquinol oxidase subunit I
MTSLELARLQFGVTTLYHFIFVPVTIGMALFVAICQTAWHRTGNDAWLRATRFWGKLMLISFALGVVTGIVQEFQFGMNWSQYSRYVGDIFGAPLAMEGLAAFFVESTFLGLWLFGWGRLSARVHLATIWLVAASTVLSAYFILAANSWMQHPVGYTLNPVTKRAELDSIWAVLTNSTALMAFAHTILAALTTAGLLVVAVSAWHMLRRSEPEVFSRSMRIALPGVAIAVLLTMGVGHFQGDLLEDQQPMKMAAADAVFNTEKGAGLSLFATGDFKANPGALNRNVEIPHLLSIIATNTWDGEVKGINQINAEYRAKYGPGQYAPPVAVEYWMWRAMIGAGTLMFILALIGLFLARTGRLETSRRWLKVMVFAAALPFVANFAGWIFTEVGRQPWVVQGLLKTDIANSPSVSATEVWITLIGFTLLYGVLAVIAGRVFLRKAKAGPDPAPSTEAESESDSLALAY